MIREQAVFPSPIQGHRGAKGCSFLLDRQHDVLLLRQWSNHLQGDETHSLSMVWLCCSMFHLDCRWSLFLVVIPPTNHISTSEMVRTLRNRMRASASWVLLAAKARFVGSNSIWNIMEPLGWNGTVEQFSLSTSFNTPKSYRFSSVFMSKVFQIFTSACLSLRGAGSASFPWLTNQFHIWGLIKTHEFPDLGDKHPLRPAILFTRVQRLDTSPYCPPFRWFFFQHNIQLLSQWSQMVADLSGKDRHLIGSNVLEAWETRCFKRFDKWKVALVDWWI